MMFKRKKRTVSGYKTSDGTRVKSYKRKKQLRNTKRSVSGYKRKDGTKVKGYTRKKL
ncbi:MAG: hypothetical protein ACOC56_07110 [Atribacterota bacterium]